MQALAARGWALNLIGYYNYNYVIRIEEKYQGDPSNDDGGLFYKKKVQDYLL